LLHFVHKTSSCNRLPESLPFYYKYCRPSTAAYLPFRATLNAAFLQDVLFEGKNHLKLFQNHAL
jgi:hypothetical protein